MTLATPTRAFARAASALVGDRDITDVLATLVQDAMEAMSAAAIGILVRADNDELELLAASSHRAAALEVFQSQQGEGPCVDAITTSSVVVESGAESLRDRWPGLGERMVDAGYLTVHAYPMHWQGMTLGAMNVFDTGPARDDAELRVWGQAFADIATLVILQPDTLSESDVALRTREALAGRTVIEQAKGVLAYQRSVDMDQAYDDLRALAVERNTSLTVTAVTVVTEATRPRS